MPISPLFLASTTVLKQRLRLSGVKPSGEILIEDAIESARVTFYRRLGLTRVTVLLSYSYTENPTTENGILRALANQTETRLIRAQLLRTMSTLFKDGSGSASELWNQEGIFRTRSVDEIRSETGIITSEVEDAFDILSGVEAIGEDVSIRINTIGPDVPASAPGIQTNWS